MISAGLGGLRKVILKRCNNVSCTLLLVCTSQQNLISIGQYITTLVGGKTDGRTGDRLTEVVEIYN